MKKILIVTCILSLIIGPTVFADARGAATILIASSGYRSSGSGYQNSATGYKNPTSGYNNAGSGFKNSGSDKAIGDNDFDKRLPSSNQKQLGQESLQGLQKVPELETQIGQLQQLNPEELMQMMMLLQNDPEFIKQMKKLQQENPEQAKQIELLLQKMQGSLK